jgi:hypothetical protein
MTSSGDWIVRPAPESFLTYSISSSRICGLTGTATPPALITAMQIRKNS